MSASPESRFKPRHPLSVQWSVIHAIFVRNLSAQFGKLRGGLLWAFAEPILQVLLFTMIFTLRGRHELNNIPIAMLVITGIVPFILFRQTATGASRAIERAGALFNYRLVKPIDPVLADALRQSVFFVFTLTIFVPACHLIGLRVEQVVPLILIVNIVLLLMIGLGLGFILCVIMTAVPEARKITGFLIRPLFFISGIFFSADSIPSDYREYLLINPLLHVTEITRSCFYYTYPSHGDLGYVASWAIALFTIGLAVFHLNRGLFHEE